MALALTLYSLFALITVVGAYLIGAHFRSRTAGFWWAVGLLVLFILLFAGLELMIHTWGP